MTFSQFASTLHSVLPGGQGDAQFVRTLIEQITDVPPDIDHPVDGVVDATLRSYLKGTRSITRFAKKLRAYIDTGKFEDYINSFPDVTLDNLCRVIQPDCPSATPYNIGRVLAELFQTILLDTGKPNIKSAILPAEDDGWKHPYGLQLALECHGICPNDGCTQSLLASIDGTTQLCCKVLVLDESRPATPENLLPLCPSCYAKVKQSQAPQVRRRMQELKEQLLWESQQQAILSAEHLEHGVEQILNRIALTPPEKLEPLNHPPVSVRKKIEPRHNLLYVKVLSYVTAYYSNVDQWLKQLDQKGTLCFQTLCNQMRLSYLKLELDGLSQPEIFQQLVEWLHGNTNQDRSACEVVVSYFVQNSEVFHEVSQ